MAQKSPLGCFRDPIWQFIGVVVAVITIFITIVIALLQQTPTPNQVATNSPTVTPTITVTQADATTPSPTPTPLPTDTPTADVSTPAATFPPNPAPATQVKDALPLLLDCHCPSNPMQIQVTEVHIDSVNGRMIWKLALRNISTKRHEVRLSHLILELNGQESKAEGGVVDNPLFLNPNEVEYSTIDFTFVPQQTTYILKLGVWLDPGVYLIYVSYDGPSDDGTNQITFK